MGIEQLDAFMAAIRKMESSGNYQAIGPPTKWGRATGAYQFIDATWGNYGGYSSAHKAPPEIQDQRARELMTDYYYDYGQDWGAVAVAWHSGPGNADDYLAGKLSGDVGDVLGTSTLDYASTAVSLMGGQPATNQQGGAGSVPINIPKGGVIYSTGFAPIIRYEVFPNVYVDFIVDTTDIDFAASGYDLNNAPRWEEPPDGSQHIAAADAGGVSNLQELWDDGYTSLSDFVNDVIGQFFTPGNPALANEEIQAIIMEIAINPGLVDTPGLIQAKIEQTDYWNQHTITQREWNDLPQAEKDARISRQAGQISDTYWAQVGERLPITDETVQGWALAVASGEKTYSQIEQEIWDIAAGIEESPFNRAQRDEEENKRQRGVDIENEIGSVRALANQWGVEMSEDLMQRWGKDIIENVKSDEDLAEWLKDQAEILYPWKDREIATMDAAQPWLTTYQNVLETADPGLMNPEIQKALQEGTAIFDFRKQLQSRPEWMGTKNARDRIGSAAGRAADLMGFQ